MFSDILTPLPSIGIEWDIKKGFGPIISTPIRRCVAHHLVRYCLNLPPPNIDTPWVGVLAQYIEIGNHAYYFALLLCCFAGMPSERCSSSGLFLIGIIE